MNQLDNEMFTCQHCQKEFSHVDGTWLPTGRLIGTAYCTKLPAGTDVRFPHTPVLAFSLREPEVETEDSFTCYDCTGFIN